MNKLFSFLTSISIAFVVLLPVTTFAATYSFKITDPFVAPPPPVTGVGRVIFAPSMTVEYKGGKMILSANPDGTGSMNVGDQVQVWVSSASGFSIFNYQAYTPGCIKDNLLPPTDLTNNFTLGPGNYNIVVRIIDWCGGNKNISSMYLVNQTIDPTATPTSTPSPTLTPTPAGPQPFLELPWNYSAKGLSFNDAAMSMTSYFDHTYPLLSAGLTEKPNEVTTFEGEESFTKSYSSHDGYDYARTAKVLIGDPVLAAADGVAQYVSSCGPCGNMIQINHGNGFQTRYMHMQKDGLITAKVGEKVSVKAGQQIGKVGATGNVSPSGDAGAHIHFMVVEDKNKDGNFDDNMPDGLVDPFGWTGKQTDPWPSYAFNYGGKSRTGDKSSYLWKKKLDGMTVAVPVTGKTVVVGNYTASFPANATNYDFQLEAQSSPIVSLPDLHLRSLGASLSLIAKDLAGKLITQFANSYTLSVSFQNTDTSLYKDNSFSFYSSVDGFSWNKEPTTVDMVNKTATAQINHMTKFAFMAERKDITAPVTQLVLSGQRGTQNNFRSDVNISFNATDDVLGSDYTMYKVDGSEWTQFVNPVAVTSEGLHTVEFYSVDKDDNIEAIKKEQFRIDKTIPELSMHYDPIKQDIIFVGSDDKTSLQSTEQWIDDHQEVVSVTDEAGNAIQVVLKDRDKGKTARATVFSIQYNDQTPIMYTSMSLFAKLELTEMNAISSLDQNYVVNDLSQAHTLFTIKKSSTKYIVNQGGQTLQSTIAGMPLLYISTDKGVLSYTLQ